MSDKPASSTDHSEPNPFDAVMIAHVGELLTLLPRDLADRVLPAVRRVALHAPIFKGTVCIRLPEIIAGISDDVAKELLPHLLEYFDRCFLENTRVLVEAQLDDRRFLDAMAALVANAKNCKSEAEILTDLAYRFQGEIRQILLMESHSSMRSALRAEEALQDAAPIHAFIARIVSAAVEWYVQNFCRSYADHLASLKPVSSAIVPEGEAANERTA